MFFVLLNVPKSNSEASIKWLTNLVELTRKSSQVGLSWLLCIRIWSCDSHPWLSGQLTHLYWHWSIDWTKNSSPSTSFESHERPPCLTSVYYPAWLEFISRCSGAYIRKEICFGDSGGLHSGGLYLHHLHHLHLESEFPRNYLQLIAGKVEAFSAHEVSFISRRSWMPL